MTQDAQQLGRTAQRLVVEYRRGSGSPPNYNLSWEPIWGAKVDRIEINHGAKPSTARVWFPALRWQQSGGPVWSDMIRIRTDEPGAGQRTILFVGFIVNCTSEFSGGTERPGTAFERSAVVCMDHRWLLRTTCPIVGQVARSRDNYENYGTVDQAPIDGRHVWLTGQRAIFNPEGRPNRDPDLFVSTLGFGDTPIFCDPSSEGALYWTAREMLWHAISPFWNNAYRYLPVPNADWLIGLDHADWSKVINHIVIDGLNAIDAVQHICRHLGWNFREDHYNNGVDQLVFFKINTAVNYHRSNTHPTALHLLHAPAVGEELAVAVGKGRKMLWAMSLAEDIATLVNRPVGMGRPHRFEFTAELVPAWPDDLMLPDTSKDNASLFFTEAELQDMEDPDAHPYYKFYHTSGSFFRLSGNARNVGRRWALNESGRYSLDPYDRGEPFDFAEEGCIPPEFALDQNGKRVYAPYTRKLLPCLTTDIHKVNSVGICVEFSLDAGETWQVLPASISLLPDECGIYIEEANLAEMSDLTERKVDEDWADEDERQLHGMPLNFWTSLCMDKLWDRSFKDSKGEKPGEKTWQTLVRITASVQMDQRLIKSAPPTAKSGSPFDMAQVYDWSEKYGLASRTESSIFAKGPTGGGAVTSCARS